MENTKDVTGGSADNPEAWSGTIDAAGAQSLDTPGGMPDLTQPTTGRTSSTVNQRFDRFSDKATQAKAMLSEKFDQLKGQQGKWADDARVRVRENPMMAMGIAVAAGFLLRRLLSRPRR